MKMCAEEFSGKLNFKNLSSEGYTLNLNQFGRCIFPESFSRIEILPQSAGF